MNEICANSVAVARPASQPEGGGSIPTFALHFQVSEKIAAVEFVRQHHSRLPKVQNSPWQFAFTASVDATIVAAALWNNPSARCLPGHWLELRRLACSPEAPKNTASSFIGWMVRYFRKECPEREKCISYQDMAVHQGTIYRASGWVPEYVSKPRVRDRSNPRTGTTRKYRSDLNGVAVAASAKTRWSKLL